MKWKVIDSGVLSAEENMQKDKDLLVNLEDEAILHFYEWNSPSFTYGYFVDPKKFFKTEVLENKTPFCFAKRPTGGGIVFHHIDFAFSILIPSSMNCFSREVLKNYHFINSLVLEALEESFLMRSTLLLKNFELNEKTSSENFFCMATPTKYDILIEGKKVGGAAQRTVKKGFLHQGSVFFKPITRDFCRNFLKHEIADFMYEKFYKESFTLFPSTISDKDFLLEKKKFKTNLKKYFIKLFS